MQRPLSTRGEIVAVLVSLLGLAGSALPTNLGTTHRLAIAALGLSLAFGLWLWSRRSAARDRTSPLAVDLEGSSVFRDEPHESCRAFRVRNTSLDTTIEEIRVHLVQCDQQNANFYPVLLQRTDGGSQPFSLNPGADVYINLIRLRHGAPEFDLAYDDDDKWPATIRLGLLTLHVSVTAKNVTRVDREFSANVGSDGRLLPLQLH